MAIAAIQTPPPPSHPQATGKISTEQVPCQARIGRTAQLQICALHEANDTCHFLYTFRSHVLAVFPMPLPNSKKMGSSNHNDARQAFASLQEKSGPGNWKRCRQRPRSCSRLEKVVDDLIVDWLRLRCILGRCKELLRTRRSKKAGEQRRKTLLDVWPNMSSTHRPNLQVPIICGQRSMGKPHNGCQYLSHGPKVISRSISSTIQCHWSVP